jgi:hypothetical protein
MKTFLAWVGGTVIVANGAAFTGWALHEANKRRVQRRDNRTTARYALWLEGQR